MLCIWSTSGAEAKAIWHAVAERGQAAALHCIFSLPKRLAAAWLWPFLLIPITRYRESALNSAMYTATFFIYKLNKCVLNDTYVLDLQYLV